MPLESVMIVVDNADPSRNGDYPPSRWEAQTDAANLIFHSKTQDNPESSCGLLSLSGPLNQPEVLCTLTNNPGKILDGLHRVRVKGSARFGTGLSIAGLCLKHRGNKSSRQRIVAFVCSPIEESEAQLVKLGKRMKKNGTSVDVVAFGDLTDEQLDKLRAFNDAVKGGDGSHLEIVPPGPNLLSDSIIASPILAGEGGAPPQGGEGGASGAGGAGNDFEFGVDPSLDPELALVLRMSMEEERERQTRETRASDEAAGKTALESVPEEGKESEGSGSAQVDGSGEASESTPLLPKDEEKKKDGDEDKMDTA
ncbi:proteasome regulatory particle base subunit rpn10 [Elasticomyces elasticus]|nr:proteasome regulatory particle base subunit rpn10 [Elasticomyces elasticus]KAK3637944.1 proteasome regulatory particle base subunit rpn10 [Elasticomyces elasticus]KAK4910711.1 proteasome regulatory particle base subunit rpn10 [Elasticomyces elasticus]KAK5751454.1 proteasome regulatory particle base subunit rpn10 [Elasticomyces elasticus]